MSRGYIGIDLGTSSVKVLCRYEDDRVEKAKAEYDEISPEGWYHATLKALSQVDTSEASAIGLSSQVGTYIVNGREVLGWNSPAGASEVNDIKKCYESQAFIREISMPHPDIASYPIPRLTYIQKKWGDGAEVCQPKDLLGKMLTGRYATDKYSWRGLANLEKDTYSDYFLKSVGRPKLPELMGYTAKLGNVTEEVSSITGLPQGLPVYIGLNDFFASLIGMGVSNVGDMFDITGTSEHLGIITSNIDADTSMVSGPYIENFVHYGVTASSGASLDFGMKQFGYEGLSTAKLPMKDAPVFTPYLNGERAPVFDSNATGMFFGINGGCTKEHLAYAVLEGVVFSIYHIYENLGFPAAEKLIVSGGAAKNPVLNALKAEMFGIPVTILEESDTSALGAAMIAAVGAGAYPDIKAAAVDYCKVKQFINPTGIWKPLLSKRFEIYRELYPQLKLTCKRLKEVQL